MTYKEAYMQCQTVRELNEMVETDIAWAIALNPDRLPIIKKAMLDVMNEKFPNYEGN